MTRFTIHKRKFLKKLAKAKKQIPNDIKNQSLVELIQNTKAATHKINEKCPLNLFKLTILNKLFINQLMIIQSQPIPKHKKGGIVSEKEALINKYYWTKEEQRADFLDTVRYGFNSWFMLVDNMMKYPSKFGIKA